MNARVHTGRDAKGRRTKSGFTLVEVLLSVMITAALMAAVSVALHGSLTSYRENEKISTATQAVRVVLTRITQEIRRAEAVQTSSQSVQLVPADAPGETVLFDRTADGVLHYRRTTGAGTVDAPLLGADGQVTVESFSALSQMAQDDEGVWYTARVTLRLVISTGGQQFSATASACPRRNQEY